MVRALKSICLSTNKNLYRITGINFYLVGLSKENTVHQKHKTSTNEMCSIKCSYWSCDHLNIEKHK